MASSALAFAPMSFANVAANAVSSKVRRNLSAVPAIGRATAALSTLSDIANNNTARSIEQASQLRDWQY